MKKLLLVSLILAVSLCTKAQKIIGDDMEDGYRYTATNGILCGCIPNDTKLYISLTSSINEQIHDTIFSFVPELECNYLCEVKRGDAIKLTLFDDSIIELTAVIGDKADQIGTFENGEKRSTFNIFPTYDLSLERLKRIIHKGVKNIDIDMKPSNKTLLYPKDEIGKALEKLLPILAKKIAMPL